MKHALLLFFTLFTIAASAQAPRVSRLMALLTTQNGDEIKAYTDSLGYTQQKSASSTEITEDYTMQTFSKRDTSVTNSYLTYLVGYNRNMNQGPSTLSFMYYTSSKTEYDNLVTEVKGMTVKEIRAGAIEGSQQYYIGDYVISTYPNVIFTGPKYSISVFTIF